MRRSCAFVACFFFNDTATTEIYTLSLHDALPISMCSLFLCGAGANGEHWQDLFREFRKGKKKPVTGLRITGFGRQRPERRSEEHTSELQSQSNIVCRLLLEKKKSRNTHASMHSCR